jgi:hypothetical protein
MALSTNFFYDGSDLASSTKIFLDKLGLIPAPNGFYKEGGFVREYVDGAFVSLGNCNCENPCDFTFATTESNLSVYDATLPLDDTTGAIVFRLDVIDKNAGISAVYDSVDYKNIYVNNTLLVTSEDFVIFGEASAAPCPNTSSNQSYSDVDRYIMSAGNFEIINTISLSVLTSQVHVTGLGVGMLIIPKPNVSPFSIDIRVYGLCQNFSFSLDSNCVEQADEITLISGPYPNSEEVCSAEPTEPIIYYYIKRNPSAVALSEGDVFFFDPYCENPLSEGYYIISRIGLINTYIQIGAEGVLVGEPQSC